LENSIATEKSPMATKTTFTPEEWQVLMEGVMSSGMAVTAADPSGLWGLLKEGFANASALQTAKADPQSNELIKAIVTDFESSDGRKRVQDGLRKRFEGAKSGEVKTRAIETLRQASSVLAAKAPDEAASVRTWLRTVGERVAEAAPEGGFLGFGGVPVSEAEKATLSEISDALSIRT
jgi:hypothetical protein